MDFGYAIIKIVKRKGDNVKEPKEIKCNECGKNVVLFSSWANECEGCGTEYNGFGQQLASREQWGYETDEQF